MATAFQPTAFQNNAFQFAAPHRGGHHGGSHWPYAPMQSLLSDDEAIIRTIMKFITERTWQI